MTWGEFGYLISGLLLGYVSYPVITVLLKVYSNAKKANNE